MSAYVNIDELERDLGQAAALQVLAEFGGTERYIPGADRISSSEISRAVGEQAAAWLALRHGGSNARFPSRGARESDRNAALLRAAILDAGLTQPTRTANDIAQQFNVTQRWVERVREQLRQDEKSDDLPLFSRTGSG